ncbi:MAG TPA: CHRD domain-containing protein [Gemmatimonadales bacterium]|jgi:hypothetical protein|nr:CHRD domain-containing protein [Gemmatimonadales bacterium]
MRIHKLCSLMAAVTFAGVVACGFESNITYPVLPAEEFEAAMSGAQEIPAVTTTATGTARFAVLYDTILAFRIDVAGIDSTTAAHIHEGAAGASGPILVTLFTAPTVCTSSNVASPRCRAGFTGPLAQGQVRPSQMRDTTMSGYGVTLRDRYDSLLVRINNGTVYVNVHNRANPGGHMRGQTAPVP